MKNCAVSDIKGSSNMNAIGILVRNSYEGVSMTIGAYLSQGTAVIVDIDKTPIERIEMIFQDAGIISVLVLDKEEDIVKSLITSFSIYAWKDIIVEVEDASCPIKPPSNESHPFAIYYTR